MLLFMRGALFLGGGRIVVDPSWIEVKEHGQHERCFVLGRWSSLLLPAGLK